MSEYDLYYIGKGEGEWRLRHAAAIVSPHGPEVGIVHLLRGWLAYADCHLRRYESTIGEDGFLGPEWAKIGGAIRDLLNGELGRLDAGSLDTIICNRLEENGFSPEDY